MSRGGRGGGRGGRGGGGPGGKGSAFTPQLMGGLNYQDIINYSKQGTGVLYPPMELPNTDWPTETESTIARRYNRMTSEMKATSTWIDPPSLKSIDIERYVPPPTSSSSSTAIPKLETLKDKRKLDKDLFPSTVFEALFEKTGGSKKRSGTGSSKVAKKKLRVGLLEGGDDEPLPNGDNSGNESEEDQEGEEGEGIEEDEEYEDENDYGDNYFDNGEDDGGDGAGDALGGGGDEDGGVFD